MEVYQDAHVYDTGMIVVVEIMGRHAGWLAAAPADDSGGASPRQPGAAERLEAGMPDCCASPIQLHGTRGGLGLVSCRNQPNLVLKAVSRLLAAPIGRELSVPGNLPSITPSQSQPRENSTFNPPKKAR